MFFERHDVSVSSPGMAAQIDRYPWSETTLGPMAQWPEALRLTTRLVLDSALPAIILWGRELTQIYNDAYVSILGMRHPMALGLPTRSSWPELWHCNELNFRRVLDNGESLVVHDHALAVEFHGASETRYFTVSYTPARDADGVVQGVVVFLVEDSHKPASQQKHQQQPKLPAHRDADRLRELFSQAPNFMALTRGPAHVFEVANAAFVRLTNGRPVLDRSVREAFPEDDGQNLAGILDNVYASGTPHVAHGQSVRLMTDSATEPLERHLDFVCQPIKDAAGAVTGIFVSGTDVSAQHAAQMELSRTNEKLSASIAMLRTAANRQDFQLELAVRLRGLRDPNELMSEACKMLGEHLMLSRVLMCDIREDQHVLHVHHDWAARGYDSVAGQRRKLDALRAQDVLALQLGEVLVQDDVPPDSPWVESPAQCPRFGMRASLIVPLIRRAELTAVLCLHHADHFQWSLANVDIAQDVAQWTWAAAENARAQAALQAERDQSQYTFDHMIEGFAILDPDWRVVQINSAGLRYARRSAEEVIGNIQWDIWPETRGTAMERSYRRVMAHGGRESVTQRVEFADGAVVHFEVNVQPMLGGGLAIFFRDVTAQRDAEAALRISQTRAEAALQVAQLGTFLWYAEPDKVTASPRTCEIFGFEAGASLRSRDLVDAAIEEDVAHARASWHAAAAHAANMKCEYRIRRHDGGVRHVVVHINCRHYESDLSDPFVGTVNDVSEIRAAESVLRDANRRKSEFLATLAHELRNPLAAIDASSALLKHPKLDATQTSKVGEIIGRQVRSMSSMLADLLDVSRIDQGIVHLDKRFICLKDALRQAVEQVTPLLDQRGQRLDLQMDNDHMPVFGDPARLCQVFANLLTNSARYSPQGGEIVMSAEVRDGYAIVKVSDNGIGIDATLLPHIFELFVQGERNSDRDKGGLGLGLPLVKNLVELSGGDVTARSEGNGKGAEFTVRLPLATERLAPETALPGQAAAAHARRILVVDDNTDAAESLAQLLRTHGHTVDVAYEAASALRYCESNSPDVFVLDLWMPGMDGYDLARRLRASAASAHATMIALSGYGQVNHVAQSHAAGFDHHCNKPVDLAHLLTLIEMPAAQDRTG